MTSFSFQGNILKIKDIKVEFDFPIEQILFADNLFIVLLDPRSDTKNWGQFPNLFAVNFSGNIMWKAELPATDTGDSYYKIKFQRKELLAYSTCSYICEINMFNGKIKKKIFIK